MRVSKEWLESFNLVMDYMNLSEAEIAECKQEARDNEQWALNYYPWAEKVICSEIEGPKELFT